MMNNATIWPYDWTISTIFVRGLFVMRKVLFVQYRNYPGFFMIYNNIIINMHL